MSPAAALLRRARCRDVDRKSALLTVRALERQGLLRTLLLSTSLRPKLRCACTITGEGRRALETL